ncbi:peptidase M24, structural domain-containing protein [Gorgonomyces haynaldii]|nr:peptidase M24, structural domain-containing protein [Gorgonomyces haynaldii]
MVSVCLQCQKPSKLRCPTCVKQGLPDAHYCSQDCFKQGWPQHKNFHQPKELYNPWPSYKYTGPLRPVYPLTPRRPVKSTIRKPDWSDDPQGYSRAEQKIKGSNKIEVLNSEEILKMRKVCTLAREILDIGLKAIKIGVTTDTVDRIVHEACMERDCYPSPLNYYNFPKSCCTSVNEVICHGIPDQYKIQDGDIVNLDVSVYHDGFHADLNETICVGNVDDNARRLVKTTRECLDEAIKLGIDVDCSQAWCTLS